MAAKKTSKGVGADDATVVFADPGLHLAALGALLDAGAVEPERVEAELEGVEGGSEKRRLERAIARLHRVKLDRRRLARVERLDFDGGNEIYLLLEQGADADTGGESVAYALRSLEGIGVLAGLTALDLDGHGYRKTPLDLRPLARHPSLATLILSGKCTSAETLTTLPSLASLDLRLGSVDDPSVLERLARRGVRVTT
jgi:hypothetical protein